MARAIVTLPSGAADSFEVFINGVPQQRGQDYHVEGRQLVFERELQQEPKLGFGRWLSMFLGIAGSYAKNDAVDVVFEFEGRRVVSSRLPIVPEQQS
jgi:hypothetical protein